MAESQQKWLGRNRPPRVQITYDVETGGAIEKKEIPLVVGVMSDLSGTSKEPLPKVKDRKFIEIDRDNFNDVLASTGAEVTAIVDNKLTGTGQLAVTLKIRNMEDFRPEKIVKQVEPLAKLLLARERLNDLLAKLEGNDELAAALQRASASEEQLKKIKEESEKLNKPAEG